jgi:hypothetical protein
LLSGLQSIGGTVTLHYLWTEEGIGGILYLPKPESREGLVRLANSTLGSLLRKIDSAWPRPFAGGLWVEHRFGSRIASVMGRRLVSNHTDWRHRLQKLMRIVDRSQAQFGGDTLRSETSERWRVLCERAIVERNPDRFLATIQELLQELEHKEERRRKATGLEMPQVKRLTSGLVQ